MKKKIREARKKELIPTEIIIETITLWDILPLCLCLMTALCNYLIIPVLLNRRIN